MKQAEDQKIKEEQGTARDPQVQMEEEAGAVVAFLLNRYLRERDSEKK